MIGHSGFYHKNVYFYPCLSHFSNHVRSQGSSDPLDDRVVQGHRHGACMNAILFSDAPNQLSPASIHHSSLANMPLSAMSRDHKDLVSFLSLKLRGEDIWDLGQQKEAADALVCCSR